jgi:hypothetical protein
MQLWRDTWNAEAFSFRKRYYRQLLRDRRDRHPHWADEADEFFALPTVEGAA